MGLSSPEYYFIVTVGNSNARSGILYYKDWIEIKLVGENESPIANQEYRIILSNGEVRTGRLNSEGYAKEENIPPGNCQVEFPRIGRSLWIRESSG